MRRNAGGGRNGEPRDGAADLPPDYGDGDLWRAAHKAVQEVLTAR
jgi:hypothetical protein